MKAFAPFFAALSTYSVIPTPRVDWTEAVTRRAIWFFPAVGLVCGLALALWYALCRALGAGGLLFSAVASALPLLLTGGIHMDGWMDTVDALSSHQSREKKLEILKDPHCGAFAVIWCGVYLLLQTGLFSALYAGGTVPVLCPGYVLSRGLSAFCVAVLPRARREGMLGAFTQGARPKSSVIAALVAVALGGAGMLALGLLPGGCAVAAALLALLCYRAIALGQFGGVTGDTSGFFLQLCELALLLGAWIGGLL